MRILFFDTETNGLPKGPRGSSVPEDWPSIVQIAWQVWDCDYPKEPVLASSVSHILRPSVDVVWDLGSQGFHQITKERALGEGVDPLVALDAFRTVLAESQIVVAHNLAFDKSVVTFEGVRRRLPPLSWPRLRGGQDCCTMEMSTQFCRLPSRYSRTDYKFPKLSELHALLFGNQTSIVFHNAANDVEATVRCFWRLVALDVIPLETWAILLRVGDP
jgi:DNA polymerase-3 subunit epsilon